MTLAQELADFTGTEEYHYWSGLFRNIAITDGVQYLAEKAKCYWLLDIIGSIQAKAAIRQQDMLVCTLTVKGNKAVFVVTDGNDNRLYTQHIEYTDFPMPSVTLWVESAIDPDGKRNLVILLPSEH